MRLRKATSHPSSFSAHTYIVESPANTIGFSTRKDYDPHQSQSHPPTTTPPTPQGGPRAVPYIRRPRAWRLALAKPLRKSSLRRTPFHAPSATKRGALLAMYVFFLSMGWFWGLVLGAGLVLWPRPVFLSVLGRFGPLCHCVSGSLRGFVLGFAQACSLVQGPWPCQSIAC